MFTAWSEIKKLATTWAPELLSGITHGSYHWYTVQCPGP